MRSIHLDRKAVEIHADWESHSGKFSSFLTRAATYGPLLAAPSTASASRSAPSRQRVILLEDLPTLSHQPTREAFHNAINSFLGNLSAIGTPLVVVISDEGFRGNAERSSGSPTKVDIRSALPPSLLGGLYTCEIK